MPTTYTYIFGVMDNKETGEKIGMFYDLPLGTFTGHSYSELSSWARQEMQRYLEDQLTHGNIPPEPTPREEAKSMDLMSEYTWCDFSITVD